MEYTCSSRRASHMSSQLMQISSMTVHRFKGNKPLNNGRSKPLRNHPQNHKREASSCQFHCNPDFHPGNHAILHHYGDSKPCPRLPKNNYIETTYEYQSLSLSLPSKHWTKACTGLAQKQIHHSPTRLDGKPLGKGKANPIVNTNPYCFLQKKICISNIVVKTNMTWQ